MKKYIRKILGLLRRYITFAGILVIAPIFRKIASRIYISYDGDLIQDGVGAQVQRIMAISGLAGFFGANYEHREIVDITTHPMDPFQSPAQRLEFVQHLNSLISPTVRFVVMPKSSEIARIPVLKLTNFILLVLKSFLLKKSIHILTTECYGIVDAFPSIYNYHRLFLSIDFRSGATNNHGEVCVHYRRGVGGMAVYHNQRSPRELPLEYYLNVLRHIKVKEQVNSLKILTDSPLVDTVYKVGSDQVSLWENTPGYENESLHIKGMDIPEDFRLLNLDLEVIVGGDPIESLAILQNAGILVMSKSSFSYVAALLNEGGQIYFPAGFWHPKLKGWKVAK